MRTPAPFILLACLAVACTPTPTPPPATPVESATLTALPASANVAPPTTPPTTTETPLPTATERPTRTPLPPTATNTHTPVATPTSPPPTAVPATAVPSATATAARADAPVSPRTEIVAWDRADFSKELNELYTFTERFRSSLQAVLDGRSQSRCGDAQIYADEMYANQRGYQGVSDAWYSYYYEYRVMTMDAYFGIAPAASTCTRGVDWAPGQYDAATAAQAIPALDRILARVPQLLAETVGLP